MRTNGRFAGALSGYSLKLEDKPLWRSDHCVVLPTLGMIVPNWFLVIPIRHSFNVASQNPAVWADLTDLVLRISQTIGSDTDDFLAFEHGAAEAGSMVGCGTDHAHLHVLVGAPAFLDEVWAAMGKDLSARAECCALDALYQGVFSDADYYLAWRNGTRLLEQPIQTVASQRLRRLVATAAGRPDAWDYRTAPFHDNIARTVESATVRASVAA